LLKANGLFFGSWQGSSIFATAGIVRLFRGLQKSENTASEEININGDKQGG
jgi:hypothetical protein